MGLAVLFVPVITLRCGQHDPGESRQQRWPGRDPMFRRVAIARRVQTPGGEDKPMSWETAFTMEASGIKFGPGVTREVGHDMSQWGARRVMVVTDPYLAGTEPVSRV